MENKLKQLLKTIKLNESMISMIFGVVTVLLIGTLVMRMYKTSKPEITKEAESSINKEITLDTMDNLPDKVTVAKGDNLWKIAEAQYGSGYNWVDIAKENDIKDAGQIEVGQELKLPKVEAKKITKVAETKSDVIPTITTDSYTVTKGDYLWSIAVRAYGDGYKWVEIARINNIDLAKASYIEIGQVLKLPR